MATFIIGIIIAGIVFWAAKRSYSSMKSNQCPGCSGGCSESQKKKCHTTQLK